MLHRVILGLGRLEKVRFAVFQGFVVFGERERHFVPFLVGIAIHVHYHHPNSDLAADRIGG